MAVLNRHHAGNDLSQSTHHSDREVQYLSIRYSERPAANDIVALVVLKSESYDNAMAETFNWLQNWGVICPKGPWRSIDDVEFETMTYVNWFNHRRLHSENTDNTNYITPAEFETIYYTQKATAPEPVTQ